MRAAALAAMLAALIVAGCGSKAASPKSGLASTCRRENSALAGVAPVRDLGGAARALKDVVTLENRALADLRAAGLADGDLASRLWLARAAARRALDEIEGADPQKTMDPIRVGMPAARRAVGDAAVLVHSLCAQPGA